MQCIAVCGKGPAWAVPPLAPHSLGGRPRGTGYQMSYEGRAALGYLCPASVHLWEPSLIPLSYSSGKQLLPLPLPRLDSQQCLCASPLLPLLFCRAFIWGLLTMATGPLFRRSREQEPGAGAGSRSREQEPGKGLGRQRKEGCEGKGGRKVISVTEEHCLPVQLCGDGRWLGGCRAVAKPQRGAKLARVT